MRHHRQQRPCGACLRVLSELAHQNSEFFFRSTVMDGAPIFSCSAKPCLEQNVKSLRGVLNSTTNLILTRMESGESFEQSVAYCQKIGIAETDPSGDIDGWDASVKVAALVTVLMGGSWKPDQVEREGIRKIQAADIEQARRDNKRWKLVCSAQKTAQGIHRVSPGWWRWIHTLFSAQEQPASSIRDGCPGAISIVEADQARHDRVRVVCRFPNESQRIKRSSSRTSFAHLFKPKNSRRYSSSRQLPGRRPETGSGSFDSSSCEVNLVSLGF
jgi:hypothetical protein